MKLLEHFKELSIYPQNAKELKGLILQLAIQGKLTAQWRANVESQGIATIDNNAKTLLEQIKAEKAQLIKEKKIKKEKALPPISKEEIPFELPESWEWCRLGNLASIVRGGSPRPAGDLRYYDGDIPFLKVGDLTGYEGVYCTSHKHTIKEAGLYKTRFVEADTLMLTNSGATLGIPRICSFPTTFNDGIAAFLGIECLNKVFLYYFLRSRTSYFLEEASRGQGQPNLNTEIISMTLMGLPPLAEQKAIVQIVDTLFKEVEALENLTQKRVQLKEDFITSALRRLSEGEVEEEWAFLQQHFSTFMTEESNVKKLRECILQLAVQGKLTKQWRANVESQCIATPDNNAKALLAQIQAEKAQLIKEKKIKKEKALPPITQEEIPYELPEGWEWCKMQDVVKDLKYGTSKKCDYNSGKTPVLRIPNVRNGKIDISDLKSADLPDKEKKSLILSKEDLLVIRSNGSENLVGRSAVVDNKAIGFSYAGYLVRLRLFNNCVSSNYIHLMLETPLLRRLIEGPLRTTSGVKNINSTEISRLMISLPPLPEQQAIVTKVNELMALCDTLEQEIAKNKEAATKLMQSVLREVFQGKPKEQEELLLAAEPKAEYK